MPKRIQKRVRDSIHTEGKKNLAKLYLIIYKITKRPRS